MSERRQFIRLIPSRTGQPVWNPFTHWFGIISGENPDTGEIRTFQTGERSFILSKARRRPRE